MPDITVSRLTVCGDGGEEILRSMLRKENGTKEFDFNRIIPMPKELDIVCGSVTDDCMAVYANTKHKDIHGAKLVERFGGKIPQMTEEERNEKVKKILDFFNNKKLEPYFETEEDIIAYGKQAFLNLERYGFRDWYDWCCANWGTKWNAFDTQVDGNTVVFSTAWCDVRGLISKLSSKYPNNKFIYEYAFEDVGRHTGRYEFMRGATVSSVLYGDYSKEAYELAFELFGCEDMFRYNEETENYEYIDD